MTRTAVLEPEPMLAPCRHERSADDEGPGDRVLEALEATGRFSRRHVSAIVRDGHVVLVGTVSSYYLKQIAQTACMAVVGVTSLENRIAVQ
jgi:osmotically-inducible protein OsmY